jgi:hypothetical protein
VASGRELDGLARDLASGQISRRVALGRLAGAAAGVTLASIPGASALASRSNKCPKSRRCGDKCCPKHASCKHGKCKCDAGYSKCGRKCVNFQSDATHCGDCDTVCDGGRDCIEGTCSECSTAEDCPQADGDCKAATCEDGVCGQVNDDGDFPALGQCFSSSCSGGTPMVQPLNQGDPCNESGGSVCDGAGNCVQSCSINSDCPGGTNDSCSKSFCATGICRTRETDGQQCGATTTGCPMTQHRDLCCSNGVCDTGCGNCSS